MYTEGLEYMDDWETVIIMTLKSLSGFWFDAFTSIPWSYLDLQLYLVTILLVSAFFSHPLLMLNLCVGQYCISSPAGTTQSPDSDSRVIRIIKVLRILRIARVLKLMKFVV